MVFLRQGFVRSLCKTRSASFLFSCSFCLFLSSFFSLQFYSSDAKAGGFAIREQSTSSLGAAFAGNAAGYDLSTIYWNSAGIATAGKGLTTESHASVLLPSAEIDAADNQALAQNVGGLFGGLPSGPNDIDKVAFVPASYAAWRINDKLTIGYGFNAPFGLASEADENVYAGQYDFREAELKTFNFNPVVGYQVSDTLAIGVGLQAQFADLNLKQAVITGGAAVNDPSANVNVEDWGFGFTAGLLWRPVKGTSIGVGYRSRIENTLEGTLDIDGLPSRTQFVKADLDLPEIVTVSLRQDITSNLRVLGTFEWTNWSIFKTVELLDKDTGAAVTTINPGNVAAGAQPLTIEGNWDDGYFLSGGIEYDYSDQLTLRTGIAYEWSPIQKATQRLVTVPDADRLWLSVGATYKYNENVTFDLAYTHIFVDDGDILRPTGLVAESESSIDIIGVSVKTKWGADGPLGLLKGLSN
ncbi:MAG: transporter [Rhizobiales bacterium]|nr:transporter [Hyphomicrobiales bacterium]